MRWLAADDAALGPTADLGDAIAVVEAIEPRDDRQRAARSQILALCREHEQSLHRSCYSGHLTGSALVVDAAAERTLLMFHRKLQMWVQPGGHVDGDANLAAAAHREATEETGIDGLEVWSEPVDLDVHRVSPPAEPAHFHLDVRYVVRAPEGAIEQGNHESEALWWVPLVDVATLDLDEATKRLADYGGAVARRYL